MKAINVLRYEVIVQPAPPRWSVATETLLRERAEETVKAIRRHVDDVDDVFARPVTEEVCTECGSAWTEDDDKYNGGCCDKDDANGPNPEPA